MDRRHFLKKTAAGMGGIALMTSCAYEPEPYRFFTAKEAACVIAMTDQIIPADESGPGAKYANVVNYIDKQLANVFLKDQATYQSGIAAIQQTSTHLHDKLFHELAFEMQTQFLQKMEHNDLPMKFWQELKPANFFNLVIKHTMQGFYGAPRHGGNKNYVSYQVMNLEYPLVVGQNRYRREHGQ